MLEKSLRPVGSSEKKSDREDEDVLTNRLSSNCEKALDDMDDESIRQIRQTIYTIMAVNMSAFMKRMKWLSIRRKGLSFGSGR